MIALHENVARLEIASLTPSLHSGIRLLFRMNANKNLFLAVLLALVHKKSPIV